MRVDQTGENILFVFGEGTVEAHVQIQYTGDPERFAWIVPVHGVPDVTVGSEALFTNLLASTVPTFSLRTATDSCPDATGGDEDAFGCGLDAQPEPPGSATPTSASDDGGGKQKVPEIVERKAVGSYDVTILGGGDPASVAMWLSANGYRHDAAADPILAEYASEGFLFLAVRLRAGKGLSEIHPLVLRYPGSAPCIPLRLTRIAAVPDMGVRAFFLGTERVVPSNFRHVVLDDAAFDWQTGASGYEAVVARAVDAPIANGHAFVTEYAGDSSVVSAAGLTDPRWNPSAYEHASAAETIELLSTTGLLRCLGGNCTSPHPLLLPLLEERLPPPAGVSSGALYSCPGCHADYLGSVAWSGPAFAAALTERIVAPGERAEEALRTSPYLTRLFTVLSPEEMTEDPEFHGRADLATVSNARTATLRRACDGRTGVALPSGREIAVDSPGTWPAPEGLPAAERVEEIPPQGPAVLLHDDGPAIDRTLATWNEPRSWPPETRFQATSGGDGCACSLRRTGPGRGAFLFVAAAAALPWRRRRRALR
jgi:MYXO-CTERM domain-containing protein